MIGLFGEQALSTKDLKKLKQDLISFLRLRQCDFFLTASLSSSPKRIYLLDIGLFREQALSTKRLKTK